MTQIKISSTVVEIPLDNLYINLAQVRTTEVGKGIDELAQSIKTKGLLEPIIVSPTKNENNKYEIIAGQRRFLAHKLLKADTIKAIIIEEPLDEVEAKTLSLTENWLRENLTSKDERDACLILWRRYNDVDLIIQETGLPKEKVNKYLRFEMLPKEMKQLVDNGDVTLDTAFRVKRAYDYSDEPGKKTKAEELVVVAKQMSNMSGAQQKKVIKEIKEDPKKKVIEAVEEAKTSKRITQIVVSLGPEAHSALNNYTKSEKTNQDEAARSLIEEGLISKGFLESDESND